MGRREEKGSISEEETFAGTFFRSVFAPSRRHKFERTVLKELFGRWNIARHPVPVYSLVRKLASVTSICERPHGTEREREKKKKGTKYKHEVGNEKNFFTSCATSIHRGNWSWKLVYVFLKHIINLLDF